MPLTLRWTGQHDFDPLAQTRALCYGGANKDLPKFQESLRDDKRAVDDDFLLAELDGRPVGTATSLSMSMWMHGSRVPCQGVAWVGTIKTHRRSSGAPGGGVASRIMRETVRLGRERGQVVSALMPFRGSFYEHFGYGVVERHNRWSIPLSILPGGEFAGIRFYESADRAALAACRQRQVESGQCDIERNAAGWDLYLKKWEDGLVAVDSSPGGSIRGYLAFQHTQKHDKDIVDVTEAAHDDIPALTRLLHFLASLRDQYAQATIRLPADLPLNWLLREIQLPHRLVNHAHAEVHPYTRMAIRILDHRRLLEALQFPSELKCKCVVAVRESEGEESRFELDIADGRASARPTQRSADFECSDRVWSAVLCGELRPSVAVKLGLAEAGKSGIEDRFDIFSRGSAPFCQEYF